MPLFSKLSPLKVCGNVPPTYPNLGFLAPTLFSKPLPNSPQYLSSHRHSIKSLQKEFDLYVNNFYAALYYTSKCSRHRTLSQTLSSQSRISSSMTTLRSAYGCRQQQRQYHAWIGRESRLRYGANCGGRRKLRGKQFSTGETTNKTNHQRVKREFFYSRIGEPNAANRQSDSRSKNIYEDGPDQQLAKEIRPNQRIQSNVSVGDLQNISQSHHLRVKLSENVQDLETKMHIAKSELKISQQQNASPISGQQSVSNVTQDVTPPILSKDNYLNLVDLYYYTNKSRFSPDSSDSSPTPLVLDEYSFKLSETFKPEDRQADLHDDYGNFESPLKQIEEMLKTRQLKEINLTQKLVDLLLDETSSDRALFEVYKELPEPGVAYIPRSAIRLLLQRMSTPRVKSEKSMLRYLSLIDDMQKARLPITRSEWSSAIYLAGRSFSKVTEEELASAFHLWRKMEQEANVKANNVTFNILFDIAVRAGKLVIAESLLKEMHDRGLRLNRFGRVSLMYYHGLRGDGDGVRKSYRDFIDAGEIVDTVVLNCVIASLLNAQEPSAAEQVYERMKSLQERLRKGPQTNTDEILFNRYPSSDSTVLDHDFASNSLGRILIRAARVRDKLPQHHTALQNKMPLTPDHITFRSMIAYHANRSGNLDRIAVLMNEMTDVFDLPFQSIHFQLLFKGFALHGASKDPDATWNTRRLDIVWDACRNAIKTARMTKVSEINEIHVLNLPSIKEVNTLHQQEAQGKILDSEISPRSLKTRKLKGWYDSVFDQGAHDEERRKPNERIHAQLFLDEKPYSKSKSRFANPFFPTRNEPSQTIQQAKYYPAGDPTFDQEEGEYTLPSPNKSIKPENDTINYPSNTASHKQDTDNEGSHSVMVVTNQHTIRATRPLICWLLRAYTRCTGSRAKVEEVWNSARKIWKPHDLAERDSVIRVLRRCLRDCDRYGPPSR